MSRLSAPVILLLFAFAACTDKDPVAPADEKIELEFTFAESAEGFTAGFADYPAGENEFYELEAGRRQLPDQLGPTRSGFYISGNNHSDDLFMFIKRQLRAEDGIQAGATYQLTLTVEFASNAGAGCAGIGGSPGEGVYFKAGANATEPTAVNNDGFMTLNLDKGQQATGGDNARVIGNIANGLTDCSGEQFAFVTHHLENFIVQSLAGGQIWLLMGVDSGFEGITKLYITNVKATLVKVQDAEMQ